jgi:hypothetical protein
MSSDQSARSGNNVQSRRPYDVFNGDADGICAIHQLRLACPLDSVLVTGVKRDIALLERVPNGQAGAVTVCDISLDSNVAALQRLLDDGCEITYFDHHAARQAFMHPSLHLHWDESADVCSSVLVDRHLQGRYRAWAAVAAFGDNLEPVGRTLAAQTGFSEMQTNALQELGTLLNYNAYGEAVADLHFAPDLLYRALQPYTDPLDFIASSREYAILAEGYRRDAEHMENLKPHASATCGAIYLLPDAPWARRISGVFANRLAARGATQSWAVLTEQHDGSYSVSIRAGLPDSAPAHRFCEGFETGGGRKIAAGINRLPAAEVESFAVRFFDYFGAADAA